MSASELDRHAARAELALRLRVVGVVAVQRGHVVGDRQAGLAGVEQLAGSARWCPRPRRSPANMRIVHSRDAVAGRVDAARERRLAGEADPLGRVAKPDRATTARRAGRPRRR